MTRTDRNLLMLLTAAFLAGVGLAAATGAFATRPDLLSSQAETTQTALASMAPVSVDLPASEEARRTPVVEAVERVAPAVVSITTETPVQSWFGTQTASGEGSGVVIDPSGLVLTNAHVVAQAQAIHATFASGQRYEARVLGLDEDLDLAVLQLEGASGLTAVPIGSSADLMLGEPVIAIGNPYGLGHTVTTGVVSSLSRRLETRTRVYQDFLQTDASINPGNSGGPLLDVRGRLVGINTAIYEEGQNIGFAIPSDRALKVARDLAQFGTVQAPWLGCDLSDLSLRAAEGVRGAVRVARVYPDTGAAAAGLAVGDVLLSVDGRDVQGRSDLNAYLAVFEPGAAVQLRLLRGQGETTLQVQSQPLDTRLVDLSLKTVLGLELAEQGPVPSGERRPTRARGVVVARVDASGAAARVGLRVGDVISEINGRRVSTVEEFRSTLLSAKAGHRPSALLTIWRGPASGRIELPI